MNMREAQRLEKQDVTKEIIFAESEAMKKIFNDKKRLLNLTQKELAKRFKVEPPSVFAYLHGQTPLNIKFAAFFAEQLQVSIEDFSPRMAYEYGKITGQIDQRSYRYPVLTTDDIDDLKGTINSITLNKITRNTYSSDLDVGPYGFWIKLESEDMVSYNGGLSFSKGLLLLVSPDEKPRVNEFAVLKIKYDNSNTSSIIESNDKYVFRAITSNGENIEARAFNANAGTITVSDQNTQLIGKVVSALYPTDLMSF